MKPATYAPAYAALYPKLAEIARSHGYAMAVHGSMARDLDVCCIPWIEEAAEPQTVVDAITSQFTIRTIGEPEVKKHGRLVYTVSVGFGECAIDLSFMPLLAAPIADTAPAKHWCETCEGLGTIDETLGGYSFSNPKAECPDCDGKGYWIARAALAAKGAQE